MSRRDSLLTSGSLLLQLHPDAPEQEIAWRTFYDRYAPVIRGFSRKMGLAPKDADDITQQVIAGFWSASSEFKYDPSKGRFRGYLKTCTWRAVRDHLEKTSRRKERSLEEIDASALRVEVVWNDNWKERTLHRAIENVRRSMAESERALKFQAFSMCRQLGIPAPQVAVQLGMSIQNVHTATSRVSRAICAEMERLEKNVE